MLLERMGLEMLLKEPRKHNTNSLLLLGFGNAQVSTGSVPFGQFVVRRKDEECCVAPGLISWELLRC